ncbi:MAG: c-type cytochrome domain-containing protein [Gemmataceae bacterium]
MANSSSGAEPAKKNVTYQEDVLPILREKCLACHDSEKIKGGLDVSSYTKLMEGGGSGAVVKPGDAEGSRLFGVVSHKIEPKMPPKSDKIPQPYLDTIKAWIDQGALENSGSKAIAMKPTANVGLTSVVKGRPEGPPPMPEPGKLSPEPLVIAPRAGAVTALAASPWAPLVAVAGQKQILLYNSDTLTLLGVLPFPYGTPHVLKFSRNGSLLLTGGGRGGQSGKVIVFNVKTGEKIIEVGDETDTVLAADISADQTQIALGGPNKLIRIYSTRDGEKIRDIKKHTDWLYALEYSPDGVLLASADRSGGVFVWEAFTGREYFSLRGHTAAVTDVSWRDDANVLATCSEDGTVRLWEMENGGQIKAWGAGAGCESVRFSHDGWLATCARDRLCRLWDQNGAQQKVFEAFPDLALRCAVTHDNSRVVAGDFSGQIKFFVTADGKPAGVVSNNPPPAAEQFAAAMKDLADKQTTYDQTKTAVDAATAALQQANANLAAAQKAVNDTSNAAKAAEAAVVQAKAAAEGAKAAVPAAQARIAAKEVTAKALTEAAAKVKASADMLKNDPAIAAELASVQKLVSQTNADLDAAKKAHADAMKAVTETAAKVAEAEKALMAAKAAAAAAPQVVVARTAEAKAATDKANAAQAAFGQSSAALLTATRSAVEKYKTLPAKK